MILVNSVPIIVLSIMDMLNFYAARDTCPKKPIQSFEPHLIVDHYIHMIMIQFPTTIHKLLVPTPSKLTLLL